MAKPTLDLKTIRKAVRDDRFRLRYHARLRAIERQIDTIAIKQVILEGEVIELHSKAKPFPKCLMMRIIEGEPIYVSLGYDAKEDYVHIITVHGYDPEIWVDPRTRW